MADTDKTCGSCVNCEKYIRDNGERWWVCESYVKSVGMPVTVTPPPMLPRWCMGGGKLIQIGLIH